MISRHCFTKNWIDRKRKQYPRTDPYLIERQLAAFELLGLLVQSGKQFLFKGGTSLVLLLPNARRLSIDVDIVGDFSNEELSSLIGGSIFQKMEEDEREEKGIPKRHFKFYYTSVVDQREAYVLLDVLYTDHGFTKVSTVPIESELFETEKNLNVTAPTINGITGDKLTAFAPRTIGVPYGSDKSMEIIKQLFDVGELFNHCDDVSEISESYNHIRKQEISFREKKFTPSQTLDDTIEAAFLISQARFKGSIENEELKEMQKGIRQLTNYFLGIQYTLEQARLSASKCALLSSILKKSKSIRLDELKFTESKIHDIKGVTLAGKYQILNKLKKLNPEAFYYWWLVDQL